MAKKKNQENDIEELENAFHNLSEPGVHKKGKYAKEDSNRSSLILIVCVSLLVVAAIVGGIFVYNIIRDNQVITAKLTVAGLNISGMTRKEAEEAVSAQFQQKYESEAMIVWIDDNSVAIPYSTSSVKLDAESVIDAAVSYSQSADQIQALDITDYLSVDSQAIMNLLDTLTPKYTSSLKQTTYKITGTKPSTLEMVDEEASLELVVTKGTPGIRLDLYLLLDTVKTGYSDGVTKVEYACPVKEPDPFDFEKIISKHCATAVEAVMDPETFEISGGTYGYGIDLDEAKKLLEDTPYGETVTIPFHWTTPETTVEELEALLFRDVLAEYTTYAGSIYDRNVNLKLASEAVNGTVLFPGDVFSYNETLGERTEEKGYRYGTSYINGESVPDIGGGICQVSSTLYYCTIVADLKIVERECHAYASSYTPLSTDATVFWGGIDFRFENNTEYPIRIEASAEYGNVTVRLIGTDTKDYFVKFDSVWLDTYPYKTVYKEMEADNEKGFKDGDVITDPYTGYKSEGYRVKYDKQTGEEIERILESTDEYYARDKVICKIVGQETEPPTEPPTDPPATTQPPTEPPTTSAPTTEPPTTEAPTTEAPTTEAPTTEAPTTEAPTTEAPTTEPPVTEAPTTQPPATTEAPAQTETEPATEAATE